MQYLSPFRLAQINPAPTLDRETLRKARALVLNQFELEGTTTVRFEDRDLDKNTALTLLDQLADPVLLGFHYRIAQDASLNYFLQGQMPTTPPQHLPSEDDPFTQFVQPFWVSACANHLLNGLKSERSYTVENVLTLLAEMYGQTREKVLQPAIHWLRLRIERMDILVEKVSGEAEIKEAKAYLQLPTALVDFMKALPVHHAYLKENFANKYVNLAISETRNSRHSYNQVKEGLENLIIRLQLSEELANSLRKRVEQSFALFSAFDKSEELFKRLREIHGTVPEKKPTTPGVWIGLIVIFLFLVGFALSNRKSHSYRFEPLNFKIPNLNAPSTFHFDTDSILNTKAREDARRRLDSILEDLKPILQDTGSEKGEKTPQQDVSGLSELEKRALLLGKTLEYGKNPDEESTDDQP